MQNNLTKARLIARALEGSGYYKCLSNVHIPKGAAATVAETITQVAGQVQKSLTQHPSLTNEEDAEYYLEGLPVVSFRFSDKFRAENPMIKQEWIQLQLRSLGWIVPK